jgi:hypothetical protein
MNTGVSIEMWRLAQRADSPCRTGASKVPTGAGSVSRPKFVSVWQLLNGIAAAADAP